MGMGYVPVPGFASVDVDDDVMDFPCCRTPLRLLRARVVACPGLAAKSFAALALHSCTPSFCFISSCFISFPPSFSLHPSFVLTFLCVSFSLPSPSLLTHTPYIQ